MLSERFPWEDFLRDLSVHLKTSYEALLPPYLKRHSLSAPTLPDHPYSTVANGLVASIEDDPFAIQTNLAVQEALRAFNTANNQPYQNGGIVMLILTFPFFAKFQIQNTNVRTTARPREPCVYHKQ